MKYLLLLLISQISFANDYKNRIKLISGSGPIGLYRKNHKEETIIGVEFGPIYGVSYDRMIGSKVSIGGQIIDNGTNVLTLGFDF